MAPRPFPHVLSVGTDICHTSRLQKYFDDSPAARRQLFRMMDKIMLPAEQRAFWRRFGGLQELVKSRGVRGPRQNAIRFMGGRWSAKEAIIKAYASDRILVPRQIEIRTNAATKQPFGIVHDEPPSISQAAHEIYHAFRNTHFPVSNTAETLKIQPEPKPEEPKKVISQDGTLDMNALHDVLGKDARKEKEEEPGQNVPIRKLQYQTRLQQRAEKRQQDHNQTLFQLRAEKRELHNSSSTPSLSSSETKNVQTQDDDEEESFLSFLPPKQKKEMPMELPKQKAELPIDLPKKKEQKQIEPKEKEGQRIPYSPPKQHQDVEKDVASWIPEDQEDDIDKIKGQIVRVSISHDGEYALATALAPVG